MTDLVPEQSPAPERNFSDEFIRTSHERVRALLQENLSIDHYIALDLSDCDFETIQMLSDVHEEKKPSYDLVCLGDLPEILYSEGKEQDLKILLECVKKRLKMSGSAYAFLCNTSDDYFFSELNSLGYVGRIVCVSPNDKGKPNSRCVMFNKAIKS